MKKKQAPDSSTGRIIFKTKDGQLVQSRPTNMDLFANNEEFVSLTTMADARFKGVRILSTTVNKNSIECLVEWLK